MERLLWEKTLSIAVFLQVFRGKNHSPRSPLRLHGYTTADHGWGSRLKRRSLEVQLANHLEGVWPWWGRWGKSIPSQPRLDPENQLAVVGPVAVVCFWRDLKVGGFEAMVHMDLGTRFYLYHCFLGSKTRRFVFSCHEGHMKASVSPKAKGSCDSCWQWGCLITHIKAVQIWCTCTPLIDGVPMEKQSPFINHQFVHALF